MKIGFDNEKYLQLQAEHITARRAQFGGKLYLEFGGKLFDDYHASRVLPGFQPDSKIRMLQTLKDDVEIVVAILPLPGPGAVTTISGRVVSMYSFLPRPSSDTMCATSEGYPAMG